MSTYENLHGRRVNVVSTNPSNPKEGEVWYNSTLGQLKGYVLGSSSWASGGTYPQTVRLISGSGTQTAGLAVGGFSPGSPYANPADATTNEYDGSSWGNAAEMSNARYTAATGGSQTSSWAAGGGPGEPTTNEEYDGSSWTAGGALNTGRRESYGLGVNTAGLIAGGKVNSTTSTNISEEYNGSSWTSGGNLNVARDGVWCGGNGTQTAAIAVSGRVNPGATLLNNSEAYDGSSWTALTASSTAGYGRMMNKQGTQTTTYVFGGVTASYPPAATETEVWNGTSWTTAANLGTARYGGASGGSTTDAFACAGHTGSGAGSTSCEEFTAAVVETKTLTVS